MSLRVYEEQCKADLDGADSDDSSCEQLGGRDSVPSPLGPVTSPLRFKPASREEKSTDVDRDVDPQDDFSIGASSPGADRTSPLSPVGEQRQWDTSAPDSGKATPVLNVLDNKHSDETDSPQKDMESSVSVKVKDGGCPTVQAASPALPFGAGHLQGLGLLSGQTFFKPFNSSQALLFHPGPFAVNPGAFPTMGMGHLLASVPVANCLENAGLSSQSASSPSPFLLHQSQHIWTSQGISMASLGGLFPYPYGYMAAAASSSLPPYSATSARGKTPVLGGGSQPRLRFNPYHNPASVPPSSPLLPAARFPSCSVRAGRERSKPKGSRESSPVSETYERIDDTTQRTASPEDTEGHL